MRYRGLAKTANRAFTVLAMVNLYMAARRVPAEPGARLGVARQPRGDAKCPHAGHLDQLPRFFSPCDYLISGSLASPRSTQRG